MNADMEPVYKSSGNGKAVLAFTVGAVAGGLVGLLMAPRKGSEVRHKIREGAEEFVHETKDRVAETKERVASKASSVAEGARGRKGALREATHAAKEAYRAEMAEANGKST
jgi:gas vesicle protein